MTRLPSVTIVIEWENAIDVADEWTSRAMTALQRELEREASGMELQPRILFLYDQKQVDPAQIQRVLDSAAPGLSAVAGIELVPTPGLTYYQLKNFGIARSETEFSIMLDSDAAPQPGWLVNLLKPFSDPEIMVVGGFTVLGHNDLLSRTMALAWIFDIPEERDQTARKIKVNANNCAVRTAFFQRHPFPNVPAFKKQCRFWLQDIRARGYGFVRTADAMTVHAPHPGYGFLVWRAWTSGRDADFVGFTVEGSRWGRIRYAANQLIKKVRRSWSRIWHLGGKVDLPLWQRPLAMAIATAFYGVTFLGQLGSALTRQFQPLESYYELQSSAVPGAVESAAS